MKIKYEIRISPSLGRVRRGGKYETNMNQIQNSKLGTWNVQLETRNLQRGTCNWFLDTGYWTNQLRNAECGIRNERNRKDDG